jgi:hypothetical protein
VDGLRKVASRPRQRLDEGGAAERPEIVQCIDALAAFGAMSAMPIMQKEIFAAQGLDSGASCNEIGEILVSRQ